MSDEKKKKEEGGAPGWIVTFADLMSLLLTFFVLLLSFSETNVKKFKVAVGSIKDAFGVQTEGVYDNTLTSNRPFTKKFSGGSKEVYDWAFTQPKVMFEDKDFCNYLQKKQLSDKNDLVELKNALLSYDSELSLLIKDHQIIIRLNQKDFFETQSSQLKKSSLKRLAGLINELNKSKIETKMKVRNYAPENFKTKDLEVWRLANNRSLMIAALSNSMQKKSLSEVIVISESKGFKNSDSFIDLNVSLKY
jgi:chemotaxis protein MotB